MHGVLLAWSSVNSTLFLRSSCTFFLASMTVSAGLRRKLRRFLNPLLLRPWLSEG